MLHIFFRAIVGDIVLILDFSYSKDIEVQLILLIDLEPCNIAEHTYSRRDDFGVFICF